MSEQEVSRLVAILEKKFGHAVPAKKPDLRAVSAAKPPAEPVRRFDSITRDSHLQRIRYLAKGYGLRWLIDQATFDRPGMDSLEDDELVALHRDMDRAMECRRDGIPFEDADLVRSLSPAEDDIYEEDCWGFNDFRRTG